MRYNNYQRPVYNQRRQSRYMVEEKPSLRKRLIEQFFTQLIVCMLITGTIFALKLLGSSKFDENMEELKVAITNTPSVHDIGREVKKITSTVINNIGKESNYIEEEKVPVIIIDDEVF
ncbi:MAG: hypothetical protein GX366_05615 [Epulopiscium sp.]|nr:hypothetical protein [Candidatus Epulonipiscium sp.]